MRARRPLTVPVVEGWSCHVGEENSLMARLRMAYAKGLQSKARSKEGRLAVSARGCGRRPRCAALCDGEGAPT